ncbi:MAG TPA: glycine zipper 2TM domain-containing protein, partial [Rhodocyclaceae bacterium]
MKKIFLASLMLAGSLGAASAQADDAVVGALVGGGVGSVIGHSVGGRNGAVVGGLVGAAAGIAIASNNGPRYVSAGYGPPVYYAPRPAPVYY